ncbi:hypothetical protein PoB_002942700 [Plakobranchus ocellatus]|uniref:Uncharacterized protein n=1 Tax=Plakobranchus ocellatus TaxID=259542 RepID=A0AAV4A7U1_9GAST|nr:hypothetical protein PoB_002942700 [Plakobranchus ocellatus]
MLMKGMRSLATSPPGMGFWFLYIVSPQRGDLRFLGPPSSQGAGGKVLTRDPGMGWELAHDLMISKSLRFVKPADGGAAGSNPRHEDSEMFGGAFANYSAIMRSC